MCCSFRLIVEPSASSVHWLTQLKILNLLFQTQMHLRVQQEMSLSKAVCCVSSLTVARWADSLHPATSSHTCEAKNPDTPQFFIHIFLIHSFFYSLFHYGLSQHIKYSPLSRTVGPCLSILNVLFCICQPQTPIPSLSLSPPWQPQACSLCLWLYFCFTWVLNHSVISESLQPCGLYTARLLCPWGFSRQEYWGRLSCPPSGDVPNPGIKPRSPTLQVDSLPSEPPGKPMNIGVSSLSLLQGVFLTQDLNWGLLHGRWILYQLSYQGNSSVS